MIRALPCSLEKRRKLSQVYVTTCNVHFPHVLCDVVTSVRVPHVMLHGPPMLVPTHNTHACLPGYRTQLLLAWALGSRATELDVTQRLALNGLVTATVGHCWKQLGPERLLPTVGNECDLLFVPTQVGWDPVFFGGGAGASAQFSRLFHDRKYAVN